MLVDTALELFSQYTLKEYVAWQLFFISEE